MRTNLPGTDPLLKFVNESAFAQNGGIVTDLDGTALHEDAGRVICLAPEWDLSIALHDLSIRREAAVSRRIRSEQQADLCDITGLESTDED
jgi:hypothetical protein